MAELADDRLVVDAVYVDLVHDALADRAGAHGQAPRGGAGEAYREVAGTLVPRGDGGEHVGLVEVVDRVGQQPAAAAVVLLAAKAHVDDVHAVLVGGLQRVENVLRSGFGDVAPGKTL